MSAVTPTSRTTPVHDLFLVKMHVSMQNRSAPYQNRMHLPFLEGLKNNLQENGIQREIRFQQRHEQIFKNCSVVTSEPISGV